MTNTGHYTKFQNSVQIFEKKCNDLLRSLTNQRCKAKCKFVKKTHVTGPMLTRVEMSSLKTAKRCKVCGEFE